MLRHTTSRATQLAADLDPSIVERFRAACEERGTQRPVLEALLEAFCNGNPKTLISWVQGGGKLNVTRDIP